MKDLKNNQNLQKDIGDIKDSYVLYKGNVVLDTLPFHDFTENCAILVAMSSNADVMVALKDNKLITIWRR